MEKEFFWRNLFAAMDRFRERIYAEDFLLDRDILNSLTVSQQRLLRVLYTMTDEAASGVALKILAEELGLSSSAVSVMVELLVKKGVLCRENSAVDRRQVLIRISGKSWSAIRRTEEFCDKAFANYLSRMSQEEYELTKKSFHDFIEEMDRISSGKR